MTWMDRVLGGVTPYEHFHTQRSRHAASRDERAVHAQRPHSGWSSRNSRQWAAASLRMQEMRGGQLSGRRTRPPRQASGRALSFSPRAAAAQASKRGLNLRFPPPGSGYGQYDTSPHVKLGAGMVPRPPSTAGSALLSRAESQPIDAARASASGAAPSQSSRLRSVVSGGSVHRPGTGSSRRSRDPNTDLARSMHFSELQKLRALQDFEPLLDACNQFGAPVCVTEEEEKKMRRHIKYEARTELDITLLTEEECAARLRARLLAVVDPAYELKRETALHEAKGTLRASKKVLLDKENMEVEQLLTELDSCLRNPAMCLYEPSRKDVAADLYYFRALVLARSGRMEHALDDLTQGLRIDPACFRVLKAKAHMERVLLVRRCKGIDAHRDHPHDYEVDPLDPLGSSSLNKMKNPGTCNHA